MNERDKQVFKFFFLIFSIFSIFEIFNFVIVANEHVFRVVIYHGGWIPPCLYSFFPKCITVPDS